MVIVNWIHWGQILRQFNLFTLHFFNNQQAQRRIEKCVPLWIGTKFLSITCFHRHQCNEAGICWPNITVFHAKKKNERNTNVTNAIKTDCQLKSKCVAQCSNGKIMVWHHPNKTRFRGHHRVLTCFYSVRRPTTPHFAHRGLLFLHVFNVHA